MKYFVCLVLALCAASAFAQNTVALTQEDAQALYWDTTQGALQLYPKTSLATQNFLWTEVGSTTSWTICQGSSCLSDNGTGSVILGATADHFTATGTNAAVVIKDVTTGNYVTQASPSAGGFAVMGATPYAWKFALAPKPPSPIGSLRIMALGDSITQGYPTSATLAAGGYRCALDADLAMPHTFVGTSGAATATCRETAWEGHAGYTIAQLQALTLANVAALQPNVILLLAGTNDCADGLTVSIFGNLYTFISAILAADPSTHIILSTIPPTNPAENAGVTWSTNVPFANIQIKAVAAQFPTQVTLVDFYTPDNANVAANVADGVHPSASGYAILEGLYLHAIEGLTK